MEHYTQDVLLRHGEVGTARKRLESLELSQFTFEQDKLNQGAVKGFWQVGFAADDDFDPVHDDVDKVVDHYNDKNIY